MVIASLPPTYGSSTARHPVPEAYGRVAPRAIIGTSIVEPSSFVNVPGFVWSAGKGVCHAALR